MRANVLFNKLRAGDVVLGLCNMYPAPGIIEGMCRGWDFVWIDGQHGQLSYDGCLNAMLAASATGIETLIRVPGHENGILGPIADLAPSAIMVPMVDTAAQAKAIVQSLRFPPLGNRSYGGRRVIDLDGRDYYRERELCVVAQVETLEAVKNADAIINTEGIDVLFFGPDDMKLRMGLPINTAIDESKELQAAMKTTADAARKAGKFAGCVVASPASVQVAVDLGYNMGGGGGDIAFLRVAAADKLTALRAVAGQKPANTAAPKKGSDLYGG